MTRGRGKGWHEHPREHSEAAKRSRPTHAIGPLSSARGSGSKSSDMTKMEENAIRFAIREKRTAMEEANLPELEGEIRTLRNAEEQLRFGGSLSKLNKNQLKQVESALEWTLGDMAEGSSYRDYDATGSFDSIRKRDLEGALTHIRKVR